MKLSKLKIYNFRKLKNVEFELSDTTFLNLQTYDEELKLYL